MKSTCSRPTEATAIQAVEPSLDAIEKGTVRNSVCRFLEYLGVVGPQLAMDEEIVVDRESLLTHLIEHDANSIDGFAGLHRIFAESSQQLPYIDVPESSPISLHHHHKLDLHLCGSQWLRKMVKMTNGDGILLTDREIRQNLFDFMKENGLKTFDEVVKLCKSKHDEIVAAKRNQPHVAPEGLELGAIRPLTDTAAERWIVHEIPERYQSRTQELYPKRAARLPVGL